jgi:hypothetical protein
MAVSGEAAAVSDCTGQAARRAFASFLVAFNRGEYDQLDELFARRPLFRWYSSGKPGERLRAAAANRDALPAYFRTRHGRGDRLALISIRFTGNTPATASSPAYGNLTFVLRRSAVDYRAGAQVRVHGKAALVCSTDPGELPAQFIVLSIAGPRLAGRRP